MSMETPQHAKPGRPDVKRARRLTPEEAKGIEAYIKERGLDQPATPRERSPADEAHERRQDDVRLTRQLLEEVESDLNGARTFLRNMQKKGGLRFEGKLMERPTYTPKQIEAQENEVLGHTMRAQSLHEGLRAMESGGAPPADFLQTLRRLEARDAEWLSKQFEESKKRGEPDIVLAAQRNRLKGISRLIKNLES